MEIKELPDLQTSKRGRNAIYPWGELEVKQAAIFAPEELDDAKILSIRVSATSYGKRNNRKFVTWMDKGSLHVQRVA